MKEFYEDYNAVVNYNSELWARFLRDAELSLREQNFPEDKHREFCQSLDLIRAINSYRIYPSSKELFTAYPDLVQQMEYVELLWNHFDSMNQEELSNLVIEMIHEICRHSKSVF
ncbi:MAG: hypothetical protein SFT81_05105 [Candidatus Caenarcaniphilales bacterium]|nr:hypothetical protein [Candidatus Caenarcaniphilales bacterium]